MKDYADKTWLRGTSNPKPYSDAWWRERADDWRKANPHITKPKVQIAAYVKDDVFAPRVNKWGM